MQSRNAGIPYTGAFVWGGKRLPTQKLVAHSITYGIGIILYGTVNIIS